MNGNIEFKTCKISDYNWRIIFDDGRNEILIPYLSFGDENAANKYVADHYEALVREYSKPKRKTSTSKGSNKGESVQPKNDDTKPVVVVAEPEDDITLVLTETDGTKYYVIKDNNTYYIRVSILDSANNARSVDFSQRFLDKDQAVDYVKNNYLRLKKDALNILIKNANGEESTRTSDKTISKGGRIAIYAAAAGIFGWKFGYKRGNLDRKNEILQEYTTYVPLGNVGRIARELIEEDGLSENFPMLIIMPSKYDYLEGVDPEE